MKLAALYRQGATTASLHVAADGGFVAVDELAAAGAESQLTGLNDVRQLFERGPAAVGRLRELARGAEATINESDVRYAPSVLAPSKIICVGLNYEDHITESKIDRPDRIVLFAKFPSCLIAHGDAIIRPPITSELDYEGGDEGRATPRARRGRSGRPASSAP